MRGSKPIEDDIVQGGGESAYVRRMQGRLVMAHWAATESVLVMPCKVYAACLDAARGLMPFEVKIERGWKWIKSQWP